MPLRDHFRSPVNDRHIWNELHGMWPAFIVRQLFEILPKGYEAAPTVHLGNRYEVDVSAYELDRTAEVRASAGKVEGSPATALQPAPTLTIEADLPDPDEFEVRIYDANRGRQLVAAIEIVSPANKDRPESRRAFVSKLETLLAKEVCISVIDLVTMPQFNLSEELLERITADDARLNDQQHDLYAFTVRSRMRSEQRPLVDFWYHQMTLGEPLPTLPIWLTPEDKVMLPLEPGYEEACRLLHIG